jgi:hypothetical protein
LAEVQPASQPEADVRRADAKDKPSTGGKRADSTLRQVAVVPGVPRYHHANCILIRFMSADDLQMMTLDEAAKAGCTPCRACQPDITAPSAD